MNMTFFKSIISSCALVVIAFMITACSSHIPPEIKQPIEGSPSVAQVREATDEHLDKKVRWGGVILNTENKPDTSRITILAYPLSDYGEPWDDELSQGRFIAIVNKFLEPTVYGKDRKITVTGKLLQTETHKIGEFPYDYPIVQVEHFYLWAPDPEPSALDYPPFWWHDPWYDPYYPWRHPYYPRY